MVSTAGTAAPKTKAKMKSAASGEGQKAKSRSAKAGLTFPVSRVNRHLRDSGATKRVGAGAPIYLSAVLEYVAAELLDVSGKTTVANKRKRITPVDVMRSIRSDPELNRVLGGASVFVGDRIKGVSAAVTYKPKPQAEEGA
jgi:histone H2A